MNPPTLPPAPDPDWDARLRYWRRTLGRLRLGVEPIEEQLRRYRGVTLVLSAICLGLALFFLALFAAFGRPDVALAFDLIFLAPIVALAWLDDALLRRRASRYLRDLHDHEARRNGRPPGGA